MRASEITALLVLTLWMTGCKPHPEDAYVGKEHWIEYENSFILIKSYDLGSVRRAGDVVIFNIRIVDDSDAWVERARKGLPQIRDRTATITMNCDKRTLSISHRKINYENNIASSAIKTKKNAAVIVPNSSIEKVYDFLCK